MRRVLLFTASVALSVVAPSAATAQHGMPGGTPMTFFVTSEPIGNGGNLGGLAGADAHCQALAKAVGAGGRTWRAYLSTQAKPGQPAVNARDRIGKGPWHNAKGQLIARNVDDLHANPDINKQTALTEKGALVNGRGDKPNMHDILTGSRPDGTAFGPEADRTCANWTSSGMGAAMVGHSDRIGLDESAPMKSWNSSHPSRGPGGGCSQDDLKSTGGNGRLYCFAAD